MSPVPTKQELRLQLAARLATIEPAHRRSAAAAASERWLAQPEVLAGGGVLICLSFGDEIDTAGVVEALTRAGRPLFVTRAEPRDRQLYVHRWPCDLVNLPFGLRQPPREAPALTDAEVRDQVSVALVLGLGFDRRGFRLGHGSGYFDRFLARHPLPALGFAYDLQLLDELPAAPHDVPMRAVVTDLRVARPAG